MSIIVVSLTISFEMIIVISLVNLKLYDGIGYISSIKQRFT